jgi:hypothetical protein
VRAIESKLGYQSTSISATTPGPSTLSLGTDDSDEDDDSNSDVLETNPPSHIRSLFQNDWLSVNTRHKGEQVQDRKSRALSHLQDISRQALQELIPSKEEVATCAKSASSWIGLLHALLPQPFAAKSQQEILDKYDEMHGPDVDPTVLASWLLTIALTTQQIPLGSSSPSTKYISTSKFSRALSEAIESTIISHDKLICTVQCLAMGLHYFRL